MPQTQEEKFKSNFKQGISRSTGADKEKVVIKESRQQRRRNLKSSKTTTVSETERDSMEFRILDNGILIDYTVTQNDTTAETITRLIAIGSNSTGGLVSSLVAAGYTSVTVAAPLVVNISPTYYPTQAPVKKSSLSGGAIAGIVIAVLVGVALIIYGLYRAFFNKLSSPESYVSDTVPPPTESSPSNAVGRGTGIANEK